MNKLENGDFDINKTYQIQIFTNLKEASSTYLNYYKNRN